MDFLVCLSYQETMDKCVPQRWLDQHVVFQKAVMYLPLGIQILEHAAYGILHQRLHIDLIDIRGIEITVETVEFLQLLDRLGGRLLLLCRYAAVDRKRKE